MHGSHLNFESRLELSGGYGITFDGLLLSEFGNQGPLVLDACSLLMALLLIVSRFVFRALLLVFAGSVCFCCAVAFSLRLLFARRLMTDLRKASKTKATETTPPYFSLFPLC